MCKEDYIRGKDIKIEVRDDVNIKPLNIMTPPGIHINLRNAADTEVKRF